MKTPSELAEYQRRYYLAHRAEIWARQAEIRKSDPTYKRRVRAYTAKWRCNLASKPPTMAEQTPLTPFSSPYGIYGLTVRSYPPSVVWS